MVLDLRGLLRARQSFSVSPANIRTGVNSRVWMDVPKMLMMRTWNRILRYLPGNTSRSCLMNLLTMVWFEKSTPFAVIKKTRDLQH